MSIECRKIRQGGVGRLSSRSVRAAGFVSVLGTAVLAKASRIRRICSGPICRSAGLLGLNLVIQTDQLLRVRLEPLNADSFLHVPTVALKSCVECVFCQGRAIHSE